jgi:hypothetical protein
LTLTTKANRKNVAGSGNIKGLFFVDWKWQAAREEAFFPNLRSHNLEVKLQIEDFLNWNIPS